MENSVSDVTVNVNNNNNEGMDKKHFSWNKNDIR